MQAQRHSRHQGDLGEAAAIQWLTEIGAVAFVPLFHSPDVDLVAEIDGELIRVQVKTSMRRVENENCFQVQLATRGGNQSWTGLVKYFDPRRCDFLFVLVADGRCWFIPSSAVEGRSGINLGGTKYSEFEVNSPGRGIGGKRSGRSRIDAKRGSAGAGEPGQTVNLVPRAEWVRLPPPPSNGSAQPFADPMHYGEGRGQTRISRNHQVTIPKKPFGTAALRVGDQLKVEAMGPGQIALTRIEEPIESQERLLD